MIVRMDQQIEARSPAHFTAARALFLEYAADLGFDLCFQGFAAELDGLADMYGPPAGCLLLVVREAAVACGAVRRLEDGLCDTPAYYPNPIPGAVYMELDVVAGTSRSRVISAGTPKRFGGPQ